MMQLLSSWQLTYRQIESKPLSNRVQTVALAVVVLAVLAVRLATMNTPSIKWTAWKEIDYLYISQNYWQHGFDFLRPEVGWPAEPPRVTEMELPLVPFVAALLYKAFGFSVYTARMTTLLAFLLLIIYTFKLAKRELGGFAALIASFAAGVLPLHHPWGKFLYTEPLMIAMSVVSLYYLAEWVSYERRKDWWLAFAALSLTLALKIESLYLFLPIAWIAFRKYGWELGRYRKLVVLIALALILPVIWYRYAYYLENTGAHLFGIFQGHNKSQTITMLSDFRWYRTMASRVIKGILGGYYGMILFLVGLGTAVWLRKSGLFFIYLAAVVFYFALVAEGNIDAPYRQLTIIPCTSVFLALGAQAFVALGISVLAWLHKAAAHKGYQRAAVLACLALLCIIPLLNYRTILAQDSPWQWERWELAREIDRYSVAGDKLIVIREYTKHVGGYDLSPVLYYLSNRQGWTLTSIDWSLDKVDALRAKGAALFVAAPPYTNSSGVNYQPEESPDQFLAELRARYPVLYESPDQLILDLR